MNIKFVTNQVRLADESFSAFWAFFILLAEMTFYVNFQIICSAESLRIGL
jgi:hypothetical protein